MKNKAKGKDFIRRSSRVLGDLFETHLSLTREMLKAEKFNKKLITLECSSGNGAITRVLKEKHFRKIVENDLHYQEKPNNRDFLTFSSQKKYDYIISNPPYSEADEFMIKAKSIYKKKIAFLLRTNYLSGQKRLKLGVYKELRRVYVFNRMPDLRFPPREDGKFPTAGIVYAWFIFEKGYKGDPAIKWLDVSKYCHSGEAHCVGCPSKPESIKQFDKYLIVKQSKSLTSKDKQ